MGEVPVYSSDIFSYSKMKRFVSGTFMLRW